MEVRCGELNPIMRTGTVGSHISANIGRIDLPDAPKDIAHQYHLFVLDRVKKIDTDRIRTCASYDSGFQVHLLNHSDTVSIPAFGLLLAHFLLYKFCITISTDVNADNPPSSFVIISLTTHSSLHLSIYSTLQQ